MLSFFFLKALRYFPIAKAVNNWETSQKGTNEVEPQSGE